MHRQEENDTIRWRCQSRKCSGYLRIRAKEVIVSQFEHNHPVVNDKIEKLIFKNKLKKKSTQSNEKPFDIVVNETKNIDDSGLKNLPSFSYLRDSITKHRNKTLGIKIVSSYEDIPECLRKTIQGEPFLRIDTMISYIDRIVVFISDRCLKYLSTSKIFCIDGTFYSVPSGFTQLFVLHAKIYGKYFPVCYCLLTAKSYEIYFNLFLKLSEYRFNPDIVIIDFELAIKKAIESVFAGTKIYGCSFHMGQSIWRKIQNIGLAEAYRNNNIIKNTLRKYLDLAFFPLEFLQVAIDEITSTINLLEDEKEKLLKFNKYFIETYIGCNYSNNTSSIALFKPCFWSCNERILLRTTRSINAAESWHRTFNSLFEAAHPNIAKFISCLQKMEEKNRFNLIQCKNGSIEINKKNIVQEERLIIAVENFEYYSIYEFFKLLNKIYMWKLE